MLYLENDINTPQYNLAFEEYMLSKSAEIDKPLVFFWRNSPSVIVGRFQNTIAEVNEAAAQARQIDIVRRITGGGAVYHDLNNLNYSFILPATHANYLNSKRKNDFFAPLFELILKLLHKLGIPAERSGRNDLTVNGKKISGAAQQQSRRGILLHGTLLFNVNLDALSEVLNVDPQKYLSKGIASVRARVANIKDLLPEPMNTTEFKAALQRELSIPQLTLNAEDFAAIHTLEKDKYQSWEWNWGKSPAFTESKTQRFPWGKVELMLQVRQGLIEDINIFGDFFSGQQSFAAIYTLTGTPDANPDKIHAAHEGISLIKQALRGKRHKDPQTLSTLATLPLQDIFAGAQPEDILELFR